MRSCVTMLQEKKKSELENQKLNGSEGLSRSHGETDSTSSSGYPHVRSTPKYTPIVLSYPGYPGRRDQDVDTAEMVRQLLLEEMVARVIKVKIKHKLRVCDTDLEWRCTLVFFFFPHGNLADSYFSGLFEAGGNTSGRSLCVSPVKVSQQNLRKLPTTVLDK